MPRHRPPTPRPPRNGRRPQVKGTAAERAETHGYARQYAVEIGDVLRRIPRELLLILKLNDCLRSVDLALGAPVNTMLIQARYTQRALAVDALARHPGVVTWVGTQLEAVALEARLGLLGAAMAALRAVTRWLRGAHAIARGAAPTLPPS